MWGRSTRKRHLGLLLLLGLSTTGCASARPAAGTVAVERPVPQVHPDWNSSSPQTHAALPAESDQDATITPARRKPHNPAPPRILRERVLEGRNETGPVIRPQAIYLVSNTRPADRQAASGRPIGNPLVANLLSEDVKLRRTTIEVIEEARRDGFDFTAEFPDENGVTVIVTLRWLAYGYDADGTWVEPSLDVRRAAIRAIAAIDPQGNELNKPYCVDPDAVVNVEVKSRSGLVLPGTPAAASAELPTEQKRIAQVLPPIPNVDDTVTANVAPGVIQRGPESVAVVSNEQGDNQNLESQGPVIREGGTAPEPSTATQSPSDSSPRPVVDVVTESFGTSDGSTSTVPENASVPETVLAEVPTEPVAEPTVPAEPVSSTPGSARPIPDVAAVEAATDESSPVRDESSAETPSEQPTSDSPQWVEAAAGQPSAIPPSANAPSESPSVESPSVESRSAEPLLEELPEGEVTTEDGSTQPEPDGPPPARPQVRMELDLPASEAQANQEPLDRNPTETAPPETTVPAATVTVTEPALKATREIPASPTMEPATQPVAEPAQAGQPVAVSRAAVRADAVRADAVRPDSTVLPPDFVPPVVASSTLIAPETPKGLPVRGRVLQVDGRLGTAWVKLEGAKAIPPAGQRLVVIHRYPLGKLSSMGEVEVLRANITHAEVRPVGGTPISKVAVGDEVNATGGLSEDVGN
jgi:hypothetical protein